MLDEIHVALRRLLHERGQINPREVDVRFEAPARDWIGRLIRPTINLFLFDLEENTELRQTAAKQTKANGHAERRLPPRRIDLHYMVSAITTEIDDEHRLLWRTLATLMSYPDLPTEILPESIQHLELGFHGKVAQPENGGRPLDLWSALSTDPRPSLYYVLTAPLDLQQVIESPLVLTRTVEYHRFAGEPVREFGIHIGGSVRGPKGEPLPQITVTLEGSAAEGVVTDEAGQFRLQGLTPGTATLRLTRPNGKSTTQKIEVPSDSYEIVLK